MKINKIYGGPSIRSNKKDLKTGIRISPLRELECYKVNEPCPNCYHNRVIDNWKGRVKCSRCKHLRDKVTAKIRREEEPEELKPEEKDRISQVREKLRLGL